MNILFESAITDEIRSKYILLQLDTFHFAAVDRTETAYCLIENTPILEMMSADHYRDLHNKLIENYQLQHWSFCENAIEHLQGRWAGELDSFYHDVANRISQHKHNNVADGWTAVIDRP
jgi:hypothetical protein